MKTPKLLLIIAGSLAAIAAVLMLSAAYRRPDQNQNTFAPKTASQVPDSKTLRKIAR